MNYRGTMLACLAMLLLASAFAASDASLYSTNTEYSIDQLIGGASLVDPCTLYISPMSIKGSIKPIYIPAGTDMDIPSLYKSSENQVDFTLERHTSTDTSSMSITLPNCLSREQTNTNKNQISVSNVAVYCHRCGSIENSMLAIGAIDASSSSSTQGGTIVLVLDDDQIFLPSRRSLLQAGASTQCASYPCSGCSGPLTVGSTTTPFDNCVSITPELQVLFTLTPSGTGTTFKGGIWAKNSQLYSGFAFSPDGSGSMIGSNSVIVYPDTSSSTGASVTGITLNSYSVKQLNAAKGSFPITNTAAAKNPDGSLSATFSTELSSSIDTMKSMVYVYVNNGPMLPGNVLGDHTIRIPASKYGSDTLMIDTAASSTTPAATPTPTPVPTPEPVPVPSTPATEVPAANTTPSVVPLPINTDGDQEQQEKTTDGDETTAAGTTSDPTIPSATDSTTPTSSSSSTSGSTDSATTNSTACSLTIDNEVKSYEACYPIHVGSNFQVYYNLEADPLDASSSILSMAMQATWPGYISIGFPSQPGSMTNAGAAILQVCSTCPTGASIKEYYMTGTSAADVNPSKKMNMTDFKASAANGVISGSFKMKLTGTAATARRRQLFQTSGSYPASAFPLIYAAGPISSSGVLLTHTIKNSAGGDLNLLQGLAGSGGGEITAEVSQSTTYQDVHMWLATISWGVLIPLAIIMVRYFQPHTPKWFIIHRAVAVTGFLLAIVSLVFGFIANNGWDTDKPVHRDLGVACTVLGLVQMLAVINAIRPNRDHKYRKYWFFGHAWCGRTAVILAIANIYYGIINVAELGTWAWAVYTAVLGCIVALGLVMEVVNWRARKNSVGSSPDLTAQGLIGDKKNNSNNGFITDSGAYTPEISAATTRQNSKTLTEIELN